MEVRSSISCQICEGYCEKGFVCPPTLHENLFTSIDNIENNLTSTTATFSIHWTGISIFQHPDGAVEHAANYHTATLIFSRWKQGSLGQLVLAIAKDEMEVSVLEEANSWIEALASETPASAVSFAAFYSPLLPLIPESVNSHAVACHCMIKFKKITNTMYPLQRPVITADQPLVALACIVHTMRPDQLGAFFCKTGDLHIEMAVMSVIGDWY